MATMMKLVPTGQKHLFRSLDHTHGGVTAPSLAGLSVKRGDKGQSLNKEQWVPKLHLPWRMFSCSSGTPTPYFYDRLHWHTIVACGTGSNWPQSRDCPSLYGFSVQPSSIHIYQIIEFFKTDTFCSRKPRLPSE